MKYRYLGRGNIQGDTRSPLISLCFIEPLLRWLQHDENMMYACKTSDTRMVQSAYAYDLSVATNTVAQVQAQTGKIKAFEKWAHTEVNVPKCALTAALHATGKNVRDEKATLHRIAQRLAYREERFPVLGEAEPYRYLGVMFTASLQWKHQRTEITNKVAYNSWRLIGSWASMAQQTRSMREVVESQVRYGMVAAPYGMPDIVTLNTVIHYSTKKALGLPINSPAAQLYNPVEEFGVGPLDVREQYHTQLVHSLDQTLKDRVRLGRLMRTGEMAPRPWNTGGLVAEYGTGCQKVNNGVGSRPGNRKGSEAEAGRHTIPEGEERGQWMA